MSGHQVKKLKIHLGSVNLLIRRVCGHNIYKEGRKEGNVLFNDALNTFYLWFYGIGHMVKDHSDKERKPAAD